MFPIVVFREEHFRQKAPQWPWDKMALCGKERGGGDMPLDKNIGSSQSGEPPCMNCDRVLFGHVV